MPELKVTYPPKVPKQPNHVDCGVFLLRFAHDLIISAPSIVATEGGVTNWNPQECTPASISMERLCLKQECMDLHEEFKNFVLNGT